MKICLKLKREKILCINNLGFEGLKLFKEV